MGEGTGKDEDICVFKQKYKQKCCISKNLIHHF